MPDISEVVEPERRCPKHRDADDSPRCGACSLQEKVHAKWLKAKIKAQADADAHLEHDRELVRRVEAAEEAAVAIKLCPLCDENGRLGMIVVCDHVDRRETHARGIALVRAELAQIAAKRARK